jgi:anti-sigma regulatory factor (Ser/Thr protein kinase)
MTGRDATADRPAGVARAPHGGALPRAAGFSHIALLYHRGDTDLGWLTAIVRGAADSGAPLQIAVPDRTIRLIRSALRPLPGNARLIDMTELGRNPARIIAAGQSLCDEHPGQHVFCCWEPAWPGRSPAELVEVARHETLCNVAFGGKAMTIVCLYDAARLSVQAISDAERTHPVLISAGLRRPGGSYLGPGRFPPGCDEPLPPAADDAASITFDGHLGPVREFSARQGHAAGLDVTRVRDLVLAVSEIAANALGHAAGRGILRFWCTSDEILCQIEDGGHIADPLAGRRRRPADAEGGHGLWLVNRVCDLVERRTGPAGTITRLHIRRTTAS